MKLICIGRGCHFIFEQIYDVHITLLVKFGSTVVVGEYNTHDMDSSSSIYNTTVVSYQAPPSAPSRYDYATGETLTSSESDSGKRTELL